ncbi:hypothetical protein D3C78_1693030 [compost metagenome]
MMMRSLRRRSSASLWLPAAMRSALQVWNRLAEPIEWKFSSLALPSMPLTKCGIRLKPRLLKPLKKPKLLNNTAPSRKARAAVTSKASSLAAHSLMKAMRSASTGSARHCE